MALGQFVQPLSERGERFSTRSHKLGDPTGDAQLRGMLFDAISNAPTRYAQGEEIGQNRRLRQETQKVFNEESPSASNRLQQLSEAAGRAGDISKASTLAEASGTSKRAETKQKIKEFSDITSLIQSSYQSELKKSGSEEAALKKSNALLKGLTDSGIGEDIAPALKLFADSGQVFDLGGDSKGSDFVIEATQSGQAARINKKTNEVKLIYDDNGNPIMKFVSPELQAAKTKAQEEARLGVANSEKSLKNKGYVPARLYHLNNDTFSSRIIEATDTGQKFLKLDKIPIKDVQALTQLENVQDRLVESVGKLQEFGIEPDPVTGRLPLVGEVLTELTKDPKFKEVRADFGRILNDYRRAITGAQASFAEIGQIKSTIPNLEQADTETVIRQAVSLFNEVEEKKRIELENLERGGFDVADLRKDRKVFDIEIPQSPQKSIGERGAEFAEGLSQVRSDFERKLGRKLNAAELEELKKRFQ